MANVLKSPWSCLRKRKHGMTPLIGALTKWLRSPYVFVVSFEVLNQMLRSEALALVIHELVEGQHGVVRLDNRVAYLGRRAH